MTLRHIKIFLSVCENDYNTTRASRSIHMTQPSVSLAIKEIEKYYGVLLFDRIGNRLRITEAGRQFRDYAMHIYDLFDDMEKSMKNWDSVGLLRVGASMTIGTLFLPEYVKAFREENPGTQVRATVASSEHLETKILNNELDLALIEGIPGSSAIISEAYMDDSLTIICPKDSSFKNSESMEISDFLTQDLLLREPGSGTRELFDRATKNAGFTVTPAWESTSTTALINAVINGLGISVLPQRLAEYALKSGLVKEISVTGMDLRRHFYIIYHKEKFLTASARNFLNICRSFNTEN